MKRKGRIVLHCYNPQIGWRAYHRWEVVPGTISTPENPYTERRCVRCHEYESEVR